MRFVAGFALGVVVTFFVAPRLVDISDWLDRIEELSR